MANIIDCSSKSHVKRKKKCKREVRAIREFDNPKIPENKRKVRRRRRGGIGDCYHDESEKSYKSRTKGLAKERERKKKEEDKRSLN